MTEYKYSLFVIFYYVPVILFEIVLIYLGSQLDIFAEILSVVTSLILGVTIIYSIFQLRVKHVIEGNILHIIHSEKRTRSIDLNDIKEVTKQKFSLGISFTHKRKVKTVYVNAFLKDYAKFVSEFDSKLKETVNYQNINYID